VFVPAGAENRTLSLEVEDMRRESAKIRFLKWFLS
jgi:hypothetical protein